MQHREYSTLHRRTLFQVLYANEQHNDGGWDQVFTLMRRGEQAAEKADIDRLADKFAAGRALVIDELKEGGQFLDWELQFMQLGMAVGDLSGMYRRIAAHYQFVQNFLEKLRRHLWAPLIILLALAWGLPALAWSAGEVTLYEALGNALIALIPVVMMIVLVPLLFTAHRVGWLSPRWRAFFYRLPGAGKLLARYQTYQYLGHLAMCIGAGFTLEQALKQSARRMPETPMKPRFAGVQRAVENGARLSEALARSGILRGVWVPPPRAGLTPRTAQLQLTEAVYLNCLEQAQFWARCLPWLLLGLVPLVLTVNALSL